MGMVIVLLIKDGFLSEKSNAKIDNKVLFEQSNDNECTEKKRQQPKSGTLQGWRSSRLVRYMSCQGNQIASSKRIYFLKLLTKSTWQPFTCQGNLHLILNRIY